MKYTATWHHIETLPYKPNWLMRLRFWLLKEDWTKLVIVKEPAHAYITERCAVETTNNDQALITYKQEGVSVGLPCTEEVVVRMTGKFTMELRFVGPVPKPDKHEYFSIEL